MRVTEEARSIISLTGLETPFRTGPLPGQPVPTIYFLKLTVRSGSTVEKRPKTSTQQLCGRPENGHSSVTYQHFVDPARLGTGHDGVQEHAEPIAGCMTADGAESPAAGLEPPIQQPAGGSTLAGRSLLSKACRPHEISILGFTSPPRDSGRDGGVSS